MTIAPPMTTNPEALSRDLALAIQAAVTFLLPWIQEYAKRHPRFKWLTGTTDERNRMIALIAAVICSAGIQFRVTGTLATGGNISIDFPALETAVRSVIMVGFQYYGMKGVYHGLIKSNLPKPQEPPAS